MCLKINLVQIKKFIKYLHVWFKVEIYKDKMS